MEANCNVLDDSSSKPKKDTILTRPTSENVNADLHMTRAKASRIEFMQSLDDDSAAATTN